MFHGLVSVPPVKKSCQPFTYQVCIEFIPLISEEEYNWCEPT